MAAQSGAATFLGKRRPLFSGGVARIVGMTGAIIPFPSMSRKLTDAEIASIEILKVVYGGECADAFIFGHPSRQQLVVIAEMIRHVSGGERLKDILQLAALV
jgi:hypothetical protein